MKFFPIVLGILLLAGAGFFLFSGGPAVIQISPNALNRKDLAIAQTALPELPEVSVTEVPTTSTESFSNGYGDIENQKPLVSPPQIIKAVYATAWSAGSASRSEYLFKLIKDTELNAIVIDIKDYSGFVSYEIDSQELKKIGAFKQLRILKPNALIKKFHDNGIYVIGRISVFQDPILAKAHPEWALKSGSTGSIWKDRKGLAWMDPASKEVWDYNLIIARDAIARGFDEINFDYIRFPSDGGLDDIVYPFWNEKTEMSSVVKNFFNYLRENLGEAVISADLFGLTTVSADDLGIGQILTDALPYFDYVDPMTYPSHYAASSFGYKNPAEFPYEILKNSMEGALVKIHDYEFEAVSDGQSSTVSSTLPKVKVRQSRAKIRPWLQDFDLGAIYDAAKVRAQIKASDEFGGVGWMLWDPKNTYTKGALLGEPANQ